jgi:membrane-bound serine protease (ClpP class)
MNKTLLLPVILQVVGTVIVVSEFFIPSGGFLSIAAAGFFGYSLYLVFAKVSLGAGYIFVAVDAVVIPVIVLFGIRMIAKGPASLHATLSQADGVTSQPEDLKTYADKEGTTVTALHPAGIAFIDGKRLDVVSSGEYIGKLVPIKVIAVTGNQVVVKKKAG